MNRDAMLAVGLGSRRTPTAGQIRRRQGMAGRFCSTASELTSSASAIYQRVINRSPTTPRPRATSRGLGASRHDEGPLALRGMAEASMGGRRRGVA
jgi:hypothetical protein